MKVVTLDTIVTVVTEVTLVTIMTLVTLVIVMTNKTNSHRKKFQKKKERQKYLNLICLKAEIFSQLFFFSIILFHTFFLLRLKTF